MNEDSEDLQRLMAEVQKVVQRNSDAAEQLADSSEEVMQAVESISAVSEENSAAAEQVSAATEEVSAQVDQTVASAMDLAQLSERLLAQINHFRTEKTAPSGEKIERNGHHPNGSIAIEMAHTLVDKKAALPLLN